MESNGNASTREVRLRFKNERSSALTFYLEPWGEEHLLPPDSVLQIVVNGGASDEAVEIIEGDSSVTLWATPGSTVSLFLDGRDLHEGIEPGPPVPAGVEVIKKLFG